MAKRVENISFQFWSKARLAGLLAMSVLALAASDAVAACWDLPVATSGMQSAEVAVGGGRVAVGLPEAGRAFIATTDLAKAIEMRPPPGDPFVNWSGFGASVALDGDIVAVGAVRVGGLAVGVEQPAGVFHTGAVYAFDASNGALRWHEAADDKQVFGHSVSVIEGLVAFGVYEAPPPDGRSVRLRDAAHGAVALRSKDGAPGGVIDGPQDAHGFGAQLSGRDRLITTAAGAHAVGIWALRGKAATRLASMPATLNGLPATYSATAGSVVAVSASGGFSSAAGRTRLIAPGSPPHEIAAGGPLAISEDRLAVLVYAAPEGRQHNVLKIYDISDTGAPAEVASIDHVIGAALDGKTVFAVLAEPGAPIKLCATNT